MNSTNKDEFLLKRNKLASFVGCENLYDFIDQFALYAGEQTIGNKIFTYELFKNTSNIPGHIAEFGCWKGSNLMFLAKLKCLLEKHSPKKIIGFDNFSGLPSPIAVDGGYASTQTGNYCGNEAALREAIKLFGYEDMIELVVGDATETIPKYIENNPNVILSFVYIDFDLYEPCRAALELVENSLSVGGIIAFDEACTSEWPGETLAMKEFIDYTKHDYEPMNNAFSKQPTMALKRVR